MSGGAVSETTWYIYMVECSDQSLYTGVAKDVQARVCQHNNGLGAKYTMARRPVELVYVEKIEGRGAALRREHAIKRLQAAAKRQLIATSVHGVADEQRSGIPG
jgi:putative endonuclease